MSKDKKTLDDINVAEEITLPFRVHPRSESSDALDDFYIRISELISYVSEVLLFSHIGSNLPVSDFAVEPKLRGPRKRKNKEVSFYPAPKISVKENNVDNISRNFSRKLFHHAISQLVTSYEVFLNELTEDILWRNVSLLSVDEKQLSTKEIFELGDIEEIQRTLIEKKVMDHAMSAYPKRVEGFQKLFHVGVHSKKSPMGLVELHDLIEVRNVIQHNDGHGSTHYIQRMSVYKDLDYTNLIKSEYYTPKIDFNWLIDFGVRILELAEFLDEEVSEKWTTTRNSDE